VSYGSGGGLGPIPPPPPGNRPIPASTRPPQHQHQQQQPQQQLSSRTQSVPLEKLIDDIAVMGFSRNDVRRVIDDMRQSGQSIDINVVVDRLARES
jgi:Holliday junction resolvasome RuvABC DNA-binding subunit